MAYVRVLLSSLLRNTCEGLDGRSREYLYRLRRSRLRRRSVIFRRVCTVLCQCFAVMGYWHGRVSPRVTFYRFLGPLSMISTSTFSVYAHPDCSPLHTHYHLRYTHDIHLLQGILTLPSEHDRKTDFTMASALPQFVISTVPNSVRVLLHR